MILSEFIDNFTKQLVDTDSITIIPQTEFRNLTEWSSLTALLVIVMIDETYNVTITDSDMKKARTVNDLFELIQSKQ